MQYNNTLSYSIIFLEFIDLQKELFILLVKNFSRRAEDKLEKNEIAVSNCKNKIIVIEKS